jgi:hypothetical protein
MLMILHDAEDVIGLDKAPRVSECTRALHCGCLRTLELLCIAFHLPQRAPRTVVGDSEIAAHAVATMLGTEHAETP